MNSNHVTIISSNRPEVDIYVNYDSVSPRMFATNKTRFTSMAQVSSTTCVDCRRLKRKCGRELPCCELCKRNHRPCQYLGTPSQSSASDSNYDVSSHGKLDSVAATCSSETDIALFVIANEMQPEHYCSLLPGFRLARTKAVRH